MDVNRSEIFDETGIQELLNHWNVIFESIRPDITICGSPERTSDRIVIEDTSHQLFILEKFDSNRFSHKQQISIMLQQLYERKVQAIPQYRKTYEGDFIIRQYDACWQLVPYISGVSLNRPYHIKENWKGKVAAQFLIDFWKKTETLEIPTSLYHFSLKQYVVEMSETMRLVHPDHLAQIISVLNWLKRGFFVHYETLPQRFGHGDFHPMNIIWSKDGIHAVIDWEFLGVKPEIYDIANMIGCLGIEHPSALFDGFAHSFLKTIAKSDLIENISLIYLLECVVCLRFAWLAEWFRKCNQEMINLEISYINLLKDNSEFIKKRWDEFL